MQEEKEKFALLLGSYKKALDSIPLNVGAEKEIVTRVNELYDLYHNKEAYSMMVTPHTRLIAELTQYIKQVEMMGQLQFGEMGLENGQGLQTHEESNIASIIQNALSGKTQNLSEQKAALGLLHEVVFSSFCTRGFQESILDRGVLEKVTNLLINSNFGSQLSLESLSVLTQLAHYKAAHSYMIGMDVQHNPVFQNSKISLPTPSPGSYRKRDKKNKGRERSRSREREKTGITIYRFVFHWFNSHIVRDGNHPSSLLQTAFIEFTNIMNMHILSAEVMRKALLMYKVSKKIKDLMALREEVADRGAGEWRVDDKLKILGQGSEYFVHFLPNLKELIGLLYEMGRSDESEKTMRKFAILLTQTQIISHLSVAFNNDQLLRQTETQALKHLHLFRARRRELEDFKQDCYSNLPHEDILPIAREALAHIFHSNFNVIPAQVLLKLDPPQKDFYTSLIKCHTLMAQIRADQQNDPYNTLFEMAVFMSQKSSSALSESPHQDLIGHLLHFYKLERAVIECIIKNSSKKTVTFVLTQFLQLKRVILFLMKDRTLMNTLYSTILQLESKDPQTQKWYSKSALIVGELQKLSSNPILFVDELINSIHPKINDQQQDVYGGVPFIDIQPNLTYLERFTDFELRCLEPIKDVKFFATRFKLLRAYIDNSDDRQQSICHLVSVRFNITIRILTVQLFSSLKSSLFIKNKEEELDALKNVLLMFRDLVPFMVKCECGFKDQIMLRTFISIETIASAHLPKNLINSILQEWMEDALFIRNHLIPLTGMLMSEESELPFGINLVTKLFNFIRMQDVYFLRELFKNEGNRNMRRSLPFHRFTHYQKSNSLSIGRQLITLFCTEGIHPSIMIALEGLFEKLGEMLDLFHIEATLDSIREEIDQRLEHQQSTERVFYLLYKLTKHGIFKAGMLKSQEGLLQKILNILTDRDLESADSVKMALKVLGNLCNSNIKFESNGPQVLCEDLPTTYQFKRIVNILEIYFQIQEEGVTSLHLVCLDTLFEISRSPVGRIVWLFEDWDDPSVDYVTNFHFQKLMNIFTDNETPSTIELEALFKVLKVIYILSQILPNLYKITNLMKESPLTESSCELNLEYMMNILRDRVRDLRFKKEDQEEEKEEIKEDKAAAQNQVKTRAVIILLEKIYRNLLSSSARLEKISRPPKQKELEDPRDLNLKLNVYKANVAMNDAASYLFNTKSLINSFEKDLVKSKRSKFQDTDWSLKMEVSHESVGALWKLKHMTMRILKRGYLPKEEDYSVLLRKSSIYLLMCLVYDHSLKARRAHFFESEAMKEKLGQKMSEFEEFLIESRAGEKEMYFLGSYLSTDISMTGRVLGPVGRVDQDHMMMPHHHPMLPLDMKPPPPPPLPVGQMRGAGVPPVGHLLPPPPPPPPMGHLNVPPPPPIDQKKLAHTLPPPPMAVRAQLPSLTPEETQVANQVEQLVKGSNAKDPRVKLMIKKLTKNNEKVVEHLKVKGIL